MANTTGRKYGGRTKGTPNKTTAELRERFQTLLDANMETLQSDIEALEPKDRVKAILELARFVLPTLKAMDLQASDEKVIEISFHEPKPITGMQIDWYEDGTDKNTFGNAGFH